MNLDAGAIIWDSDKSTPTAKQIPGGYAGAYMFSVPPTAAIGNHQLLIRNAMGDSNTVSFNVTASDAPGGTFPKPRIDSVTLLSATFSGGNVTPSLYVQGANLDVGAVVLLVNGSIETELATSAHKGLRNDLLGVSQSDLGYPIYHFVSTVAVPGPQTPGDTLKIKVRNLDTQTSELFSYQLPTDAATMDSDGDGLPDSWETGGHNGVDLNALGADPLRRDILLEVDVMQGLANPPGPDTFSAAKAVFSNAPFLNPSGPSGINLILDTSGSVPYSEFVCFDRAGSTECGPTDALGTKKYSELKNANFDGTHRKGIFHYAIWAARQPGGTNPGTSDGADDFVISFDDWGTTSSADPMFVQSTRVQVDEFTHELGHDLGLSHGGGGDTDHCYLPNHWSVMSYTWDKRAGFSDQFRTDHVTCAPFYYQGSGATETSGHVSAEPSTATDYSSGMGKTLPVSGEPTVNTCSEPVNWTQDTNDNVEYCFGGPNDGVGDVADWPMLKFDGPKTGGSIVP